MSTQTAGAPPLVEAGSHWRALLRDLWLPVPLAMVAAIETAAAGGELDLLRTVIAVTTVLGLVGRRHQPALTAAWVATGLAVESASTESPDEIGVLIAIIVAAFYVGGLESRRELVLGLGMLGLSVTVSIALDPSDSLANVPPTLLLFLGVPAGLGAAFGRRGRALAGMAVVNEDLRREAAEAVAAERRRLSHELHDVVSHAVTLIAVTAEAGATVVRSDPGAAERSLAAIADTSRDALAELQALLALLEADAPDPATAGLARLDALVGGVRATGAVVELIRHGQLPELTRDVDLAAYRVVQEAMTNALRHSRTPRLRVEVVGDEDHATLRVVSSGAAHRSTYGGTGRGLVGLRDRVEALGGELAVGQADDGSYVVEATLPGAGR
ncbi:sensor histidine kinase [Nocardioides immobilis]|uniref:sensor histidine kinase n=1 Tax=Nocardioides immobilis TaxID=2049295 RepID=UPI0015F88AF4|nr:histidine kinase [Nocardioides immobilis]